MGILNVTPDSFFDGGIHFRLNDAVKSGLSMAVEGADIIDVGGESTRPSSDPLPLDQELGRVIPVIKALSREVKVPISIDTYKSEVARQALEAGATMVNDVSALRFDPAMGPLVAEAGVPIVLMHMKGTPKDMQVKPAYKDLLGEIAGFLSRAIEQAAGIGIKRELIIIDPGIGFGKSFDDNLKIIKELHTFSSLGQPVLVGTSNKAFIGHVLGLPLESRETGTMATIAAAVMNGADIVRVHNVKAARETVRMIEAIESGSSQPKT
ncbi:MAG: dihydropteroate synthase [Deltaproteobacteria bacterium]|nr:MAG: dihydropteroate synthase [Deltaproteobacteria bacterium]